MTGSGSSSSRPIWLLIDSGGVGGAERHVATLAQSLRRCGLRAEVLLYQDHGNVPWLAQLACADVPVRMLDGTVAELYHAIKSVRPILLHTHGYKAGILGRPAARLLGVPVVSTFHTGDRERLPVGLYDLLDEWTSFLGKRIAVSPVIQKRLPFSSFQISSYVSVPSVPPQGSLPRRVGFVGRLREEKQPDQFCALARRSPSGVEWHVYGDGPMRARLEREHADIVRFHGAVSDMGPVWRSLGLLVMTSRFEGLPVAALEALAAGVPVLSSRVGGVPSIVQDGITGWLFEPDDLDGAERGLQSWLELDAASQKRLREASWCHVGKNFSEATVFPRVLAVYQAAGAELSAFGRQATEPRSPGLG